VNKNRGRPNNHQNDCVANPATIKPVQSSTKAHSSWRARTVGISPLIHHESTKSTPAERLLAMAAAYNFAPFSSGPFSTSPAPKTTAASKTRRMKSVKRQGRWPAIKLA